jgi:hypothetical protein
MSKQADRDNVDAGRVNDVDSDEAMIDRGFDRWLNRQLHRIYDPVLSETVPDEIMRLLEQFDSGTQSASENDDEHKS